MHVRHRHSSPALRTQTQMANHVKMGLVLPTGTNRQRLPDSPAAIEASDTIAISVRTGLDGFIRFGPSACDDHVVCRRSSMTPNIPGVFRAWQGKGPCCWNEQPQGNASLSLRKGARIVRGYDRVEALVDECPGCRKTRCSRLRFSWSNLRELLSTLMFRP